MSTGLSSREAKLLVFVMVPECADADKAALVSTIGETLGPETPWSVDPRILPVVSADLDKPA